MDPASSEPARDRPTGGWRRIGVDRVRREPAGLLWVEAAAAMPDWRTSRYRPTAVFFEGERFAVRSHRQQPGGLHLYELAPWPDDGVEQPGAVIEYGEAYVRLRQQLRSAGRVADALALLAVPLTPVLGLLPARVKEALHGTIGVHPVEATRASITLETMGAVLCATLAIIHVATGGMRTPELGHTLWLAPLLVVDSLVRYGAILKEETHPPGFLEWLVPGRRRTGVRAQGD